MKEILLLLKQKYPNDTEFGKKMREFLSDEDVLNYFEPIGESVIDALKDRTLLLKIKEKYE
jgi:hypothetical protein